MDKEDIVETTDKIFKLMLEAFDLSKGIAKASGIKFDQHVLHKTKGEIELILWNMVGDNPEVRSKYILNFNDPNDVIKLGEAVDHVLNSKSRQLLEDTVNFVNPSKEEGAAKDISVVEEADELVKLITEKELEKKAGLEEVLKTHKVIINKID